MNLELYQLVDSNDRYIGEPFEHLDHAKTRAQKLATEENPIAIIALIYTYEDSELIWSSLDENRVQVWPPQKDKR